MHDNEAYSLSDLPHDERAALGHTSDSQRRKNLPVAQKDPRQKRLKAFIRAHIGESLAYRQFLSKQVGFEVSGILKGFAAFSEPQKAKLRAILPFSDEMLDGKVDMFNRPVGLNEGMFPSFFVLGDVEVAQRLHALLRQWPEAGMPEELLVQMCPEAVATADIALDILAGDKAMGLWALQKVLAAFKAKGLKPPSVDHLLAVDEPLQAVNYQTPTTADETPLEDMTMLNVAERQRPNQTSNPAMNDDQRLLLAIEAYCGRHMPNWEDLEFETSIKRLYAKVVVDKASFSSPERSSLRQVMNLTEGYLFKGRENLIGAPLMQGVGLIPPFFSRGDREVGQRLRKVLEMYNPDRIDSDLLAGLVGKEISDAERGHAILRGTGGLSRRGLKAVIAAWNKRKPDRELEERFFFEKNLLPTAVRFGVSLTQGAKAPDVKPAAEQPVPTTPAVTPVEEVAEVKAEVTLPDVATPVVTDNVVPKVLTDANPDDAVLEAVATYADANRTDFNKVACKLLMQPPLTQTAFRVALVDAGAAVGLSTGNNLLRGKSQWDVPRVRVLLKMLGLSAAVFYVSLKAGGAKLPDLNVQVDGDTVEAIAVAASDDVVAKVADKVQPEADLPQDVVQDKAEGEPEAAAEALPAPAPEPVAEAKAAVVEEEAVVVAEPEAVLQVIVTEPAAKPVDGASSLSGDMLALVNRLMAERLANMPDDEQVRRMGMIIQVLTA